MHLTISPPCSQNPHRVFFINLRKQTTSQPLDARNYIRGSGIALYLSYIQSRTMYVVRMEIDKKIRFQPYQILKIVNNRLVLSTGYKELGDDLLVHIQNAFMCVCFNTGHMQNFMFRLYIHIQAEFEE